MAEKLDPHDLMTLEELALPTMREHAALMEVLDMIQALRRREPTA